jgi:hypothetical protein
MGENTEKRRLWRQACCRSRSRRLKEIPSLTRRQLNEQPRFSSLVEYLLSAYLKTSSSKQKRTEKEKKTKKKKNIKFI